MKTFESLFAELSEKAAAKQAGSQLSTKAPIVLRKR